jgi:hypothetical protein
MKQSTFNRAPGTRKSDSYGSSIVNILPMSKEKREELKQVMPHIKGRGATPEKRLENLKRRLRKRALVNESIRNETRGPDKWHVLIDFSTGVRRKVREAAMNKQERFERNKSIKDLGMEWTLGRM